MIITELSLSLSFSSQHNFKYDIEEIKKKYVYISNIINNNNNKHKCMFDARNGEIERERDENLISHSHD